MRSWQDLYFTSVGDYQSPGIKFGHDMSRNNRRQKIMKHFKILLQVSFTTGKVVNDICHRKHCIDGSRDFKKRDALCHHGWPIKKILGFRWFKKAKITIETICFWRNISIRSFRLCPFLHLREAWWWNLKKIDTKVSSSCPVLFNILTLFHKFCPWLSLLSIGKHSEFS